MRDLNPHRAALAAILLAGNTAMRDAIDRGLRSDHFVGESRLVWDFVLEYWHEHAQVPPRAVVYGKTGVDLTECDTPEHLGAAAFLIGEVINLALHLSVRKNVAEAVKALGDGKPREAVEILDRTVREARDVADVAAVVSLDALADAVIDEYERVANGILGIPLPWPTLTQATLGLSAEDLVVLVARAGVGKTWAALLITLVAWLAGKRVLFVTTEMSQARVSKRFYSLHFKIPYKQFHEGTLPPAVWQEMREKIRNFKSPRLKLIGGAFDFSFGALESAVVDFQPELLVIDGAYLLQAEGRDRTEKAANAFNELKRLGKRRKIPVVAAMQLNRGAAKKKGDESVGLEDIALSDVVGWNSDVVLALRQTPELRADRHLEITTLKLREGAIPEPLKVRWDFSEMEFSEASVSTGDAIDVPPDWVEPGMGSAGQGPDDDQDTVPF